MDCIRKERENVHDVDHTYYSLLCLFNELVMVLIIINDNGKEEEKKNSFAVTLLCVHLMSP